MYFVFVGILLTIIFVIVFFSTVIATSTDFPPKLTVTDFWPVVSFSPFSIVYSSISCSLPSWYVPTMTIPVLSKFWPSTYLTLLGKFFTLISTNALGFTVIGWVIDFPSNVIVISVCSAFRLLPFVIV